MHAYRPQRIGSSGLLRNIEAQRNAHQIAAYVTVAVSAALALAGSLFFANVVMHLLDHVTHLIP